MNYFKKNILFISLAAFGFILSAYFSTGCLKDNAIVPFSVSIENAALELGYFEQHGDYINSDMMPSIVNVDEVNSNLNNYLVIDVRTSADYESGHIPGAVNIQNDSLLTYLNNISTQNFPKIVIVSANGQSSSYYTALLRLYGFNNVYSLLFGMAQWNDKFADVWKNNIVTVQEYKNFTNNNFRFGKKTNLPAISFNSSKSNLDDKIKDRIASYIKEGFNKDLQFVDFSSVFSLAGTPPYTFFLCYGKDSLYYHGSENSSGSGHIPGTVYFRPGYDLKSINNLQAIPSDYNIIVYSYSGQISAFVVAYLRLLGYNAKSLEFGGNAMFYNYLVLGNNSFKPYVFLPSQIRNYSYVTGSSPK